MDPSKSITYHITRTGNLLRQVTAKRIKEAGIDITPEEAVLMNQLWEQDNQSMSELGAWSVKEASTLTRQIDALERKGYVSRNQQKGDRRKVFVRLTAKGRALKKRFDKTNLPEFDRDMAPVSNREIEQCLKLLEKIRQNALAEIQRK